jgi:hypothetical protein
MPTRADVRASCETPSKRPLPLKYNRQNLQNMPSIGLPPLYGLLFTKGPIPQASPFMSSIGLTFTLFF